MPRFAPFNSGYPSHAKLTSLSASGRINRLLVSSVRIFDHLSENPTTRTRATAELPIVQKPQTVSAAAGRILGYPVREGRVAP